MARYAITIFLSAFLLFQVQPLIGKFILPWFGGSPAVWTACMLFFQVLLLGGYSYAHFVTSFLPPRVASALHLALLAGSLYFLPISPDVSWKPAGEELPAVRILGLLLMTIGLPYFLLSATGPLLQESFHRETGRMPYRLYSLSNIGSLLALLTYPFVFEPQLKLQTQIWAWSAGYLVFALFCGWCVVAYARIPRRAEASAAENEPVSRPAIGQLLLWLALAACGSVMLLATTNQLCQEVTSVPFLWVLPLSIYLLTFILCFDHDRWYRRRLFIPLLAVAVFAVAYALDNSMMLGMLAQLTIYSGALWICCMTCHGELAHSRPAPRYATLFYLLVSAGGAIGGILVALIAPLVLHDFWEYHIGLIATVIVVLVTVLARDGVYRRIPRPVLAIMVACILAIVLAGGVVFSQRGFDADSILLDQGRNFYGVLKVNAEERRNELNGPRREMVHGVIQHGFQYQDADKRDWPTTYFGPPSGAGLALERHPSRFAENSADRKLRIGIIGLGCGTLAAYGKAGDYIRFYEINPEVIRMADKYFTFCKDTPAQVEMILGDARIKLEQELAAGNSQEFDVLVIDAFSSDAIPMHLLTKESVELFFKHLQPSGILCIHITNRFVNLRPIVQGIAAALDYRCIQVNSSADSARGLNGAEWIILTRNNAFLDDSVMVAAATPNWPREGEGLLWTDDFGSLWKALKSSSGDPSNARSR